MAVEYLEHSFTSLSSAWNFVNSTWPRSMLGRMMQAAPAIRGGRTAHGTAVFDVLTQTLHLQGSRAPCHGGDPLASSTRGSISLSSSSVNTYWFSGSSPERGAEVPQSLRKGRQEGRAAVALPPASIAASQGMDEGQHCLPLPRCSSTAQGKSWFLPPGNCL